MRFFCERKPKLKAGVLSFLPPFFLGFLISCRIVGMSQIMYQIRLVLSITQNPTMNRKSQYTAGINMGKIKNAKNMSAKNPYCMRKRFSPSKDEGKKSKRM